MKKYTKFTKLFFCVGGGGLLTFYFKSVIKCSRSNVRTIAEMSLKACFSNEPGLLFSLYPVIITFLVPCYLTKPEKIISQMSHTLMAQEGSGRLLPAYNLHIFGSILHYSSTPGITLITFKFLLIFYYNFQS